MRYLMRTTPQHDKGPQQPPSPELLVEMGAFIEEEIRNGTLVATGALDPIVTRIERSNGQVSLTDGPFTEAKEAIVGFAIVEVGSKDEAVELSKRFWGLVGDGTGVIQRILDEGESPGS